MFCLHLAISRNTSLARQRPSAWRPRGTKKVSSVKSFKKRCRFGEEFPGNLMDLGRFFRIPKMGHRMFDSLDKHTGIDRKHGNHHWDGRGWLQFMFRFVSSFIFVLGLGRVILLIHIPSTCNSCALQNLRGCGIENHPLELGHYIGWCNPLFKHWHI